MPWVYPGSQIRQPYRRIKYERKKCRGRWKRALSYQRLTSTLFTQMQPHPMYVYVCKTTNQPFLFGFTVCFNSMISFWTSRLLLLKVNNSELQIESQKLEWGNIHTHTNIYKQTRIYCGTHTKKSTDCIIQGSMCRLRNFCLDIELFMLLFSLRSRSFLT